MEFNEFMRAILDILPNATVGEDNEGQVVVYTDLRLVGSDTHPTIPLGENHLIPFTPEV
jgi:hypothetical protein